MRGRGRQCRIQVGLGLLQLADGVGAAWNLIGTGHRSQVSQHTLLCPPETFIFRLGHVGYNGRELIRRCLGRDKICQLGPGIVEAGDLIRPEMGLLGRIDQVVHSFEQRLAGVRRLHAHAKPRAGRESLRGFVPAIDDQTRHRQDCEHSCKAQGDDDKFAAGLCLWLT